MSDALFKKYSQIIRELSYRNDNDVPSTELKLWEDRSGIIECFYAPFEYVNVNAKIVLVGITPGRTQMNRALNAAREAMLKGNDTYEAVKFIKKQGSFSGTLRSNLVNILNRLGYQTMLNLTSVDQLWEENENAVHFTSLSKYPIFVRGKDYNGNPKPIKIKKLKKWIFNEFVNEISTINPEAEIIPLGDTVANAISELIKEYNIPQKIRKYKDKIVAPPHPSSANSELIALLLREDFPPREYYQQERYELYLKTKSDKMKCQSEVIYKKIRGARWDRINLIRNIYGIN